MSVFDESVQTKVLLARREDGSSWRVIQRYDEGVKIFPPYSEEDILMLNKILQGEK